MCLLIVSLFVLYDSMDEYVGLPREHPESYHSYMWNNFFKHIDIKYAPHSPLCNSAHSSVINALHDVIGFFFPCRGSALPTSTFSTATRRTCRRSVKMYVAVGLETAGAVASR